MQDREGGGLARAHSKLWQERGWGWGCGAGVCSFLQHQSGLVGARKTKGEQDEDDLRFFMMGHLLRAGPLAALLICFLLALKHPGKMGNTISPLYR